MEVTPETLAQLRTALDEAFPGDWECADDEFTRAGEDADEIPEWSVEVIDKDTYLIRRTLGWYDQRGEAYCWEECIHVMRAMNAAGAAMSKALDGPTP